VQSFKTITLQPRSATLNTDYPASIQGLQNIEIRPKVDGFVEGIYVDEGSLVKKGQLLFKIKAPQYEQDVRTAEAGIQTAQADVNTANLQVNKVKPLVEKDTADPLTTVYNTATIYAYFAMNEKNLLDFSRDSTGSTSIKTKLNNLPKVSLVLSDGTTYDHQGKVETVNGLINTNTGSANFRAAFVNPRGLLRSGGSASVRVPTAVKSAVIVPQNVTYELQDKRFVYVINSQNKVKNVAITVMDNTPGQFYVVTGGIKSGDKIIAESVNNLKDDTEIKPVEVSPEVVYKDLK